MGSVFESLILIVFESLILILDIHSFKSFKVQPDRGVPPSNRLAKDRVSRASSVRIFLVHGGHRLSISRWAKVTKPLVLSTF